MRSLLCLLFLLGGDDFAAGVRAYREARFADALAAFTAAESAAGGGASAALLYNKALAALQAGNWELAEAAIEQAAARGGAEFTPLRDFVRGNVALARAEVAAKQAKSVESEPFAFDAAIAFAESAAGSWQSALMSRPEWAAARRNAERAARRLDDLRREKAAAEAKKRARKEPDAPKPKPAPPEPDAKQDKPPADELTPAQIRRLLDKLAAKEKEKAQLRRSQQQASSADVQRDW